LGNGDPGEKLVEFLVVPDGELEMTGDDPGLLVIPGSVTRQFQDFSCQVFHDSCQVHGGTRSNPFGVIPLPEKTMDPSDRELKTGPTGPGLALPLYFSSLTASTHVD